MSEHTKGPWFPEAPTGYWVRQSGGMSLHIARTDMDGMTLEQQRANARLIAAAPDLLAVLESCCKALGIGTAEDAAAILNRAGRAVIARVRS